MTSVYIAFTNRLSWGKGESPKIAVIMALENGGRGVDSCSLIRVTGDDSDLYNKTFVNEMGQLVSVKGVKVEEIGNRIVKDVAEKYYHIAGEIEELMNDLEMNYEQSSGEPAAAAEGNDDKAG